MELTPVRRSFPSSTLTNFPSSSTVTVLAVDSDIEHLQNLRTKLLSFFNYYQVATCQTAMGALSLLRKRTNEFQILLAGVALPDADGFDLLTAATSEFPALQVVLFSDDSGSYETSAVRALELGACAFYKKPIPSDVLEHVWQHVFRGKVESLLPLPLPIVGPAPKRKRRDGDLNSRSLIIQGKEGKRLKTAKNAAGSRKPRLVWSPELHSKFVDAVELIGADSLTSGRILKVMMEQMGVVSLTEPQVSSHLQQYRKTQNKKKISFSESELSEPSSSYKETSSPSTAAATESYLCDQLPDITSTDYTTSSLETSSYGVGGGVVESGGEDLDWCLNLDLSFLENNQLGSSFTDLLACC